MGQFSRELPLGTRHTCDKRAVNTRRFNPKPELILSWHAPPQKSGTLVMRATVAGADVDGVPGERFSLSYTMTEVEPPKKGSVLSDLSQQSTATGGQAVSFNFTASVLHQLFIELIRNRDIAEASNMLSPMSRLQGRPSKGVSHGLESGL